MRTLQAIAMSTVVSGLIACAPGARVTEMPMGQPAALTGNALALRQSMRELWADHVIWTRNYIVAAVAGDASAASALDRLMKNQEELGNAVAPYYGAPAGAQLTRLLKDHISIAGEVVAAAKANETAKLQDADRRWHQNAEDIATFLSGANSHWSRAEHVRMLNDHLALTTQEATLRLQRNWSADAATFDRIFDQAMMMADALSDGVIRQFPSRF
jgi:nuclear transport factor 2 (NTF2) superfamily protein